MFFLFQVPVALKTLHEDHLSEGETDFKREAEVMMSLHHKCIVKLYGVCRGEHLMMVRFLSWMFYRKPSDYRRCLDISLSFVEFIFQSGMLTLFAHTLTLFMHTPFSSPERPA